MTASCQEATFAETCLGYPYVSCAEEADIQLVMLTVAIGQHGQSRDGRIVCHPRKHIRILRQATQKCCFP